MQDRNAPKNLIEDASKKLDNWIESQGFEGWDPFDALRSPLLKALTFNNRKIGQAWVQIFKRNPVNLRPLFGVKKGFNPKGMGLFLSSYLRKYQASRGGQHLDKVLFFSQWLDENISTGYSGACWGYNFDWPNRGFFAPAGMPTIVNTAFIGLAFIDLHRAFGSIINTEYKLTNPLSIARSACEFIIKDLHINHIGTSELCFSYTPLDQRYVHNANMMGAWLLSEVYSETGEPVLRDFALAACRYTVSNQLSDGSWWYGEDRIDQWIDNFHTGFVLVALKHIVSNLSATEFNGHLLRGYRFWKANLFMPNGIPKYYSHRIFPVDVHSVAQAIVTFLEFEDLDSEAYDQSLKVAMWGIKNMQNSQGYFYYQINDRFRNRIPYMRWSQAWMQRAFTNLECRNAV
jgi:hypothetical protein